jgi:RNase P subunit RPR2
LYEDHDITVGGEVELTCLLCGEHHRSPARVGKFCKTGAHEMTPENTGERVNRIGHVTTYCRECYKIARTPRTDAELQRQAGERQEVG